MIRPWYRSRLFWLGIPGLLFLLWGWVDWSAPPSLTVKIGNSRVIAGNSAGALRMVWATNPSGTGMAISGRTGTRAPDLINPFPPAIRHWKVNLPGGSRFITVTIGYWFLIIVYLPLWLGVLAGWQRHKVRLVKTEPGAAPELPV